MSAILPEKWLFLHVAWQPLLWAFAKVDHEAAAAQKLHRLLACVHDPDGAVGGDVLQHAR